MTVYASVSRPPASSLANDRVVRRELRQHGPYGAQRYLAEHPAQAAVASSCPSSILLSAGVISDFSVAVNEGDMAAGFTGNCCICVPSEPGSCGCPPPRPSNPRTPCRRDPPAYGRLPS